MEFSPFTPLQPLTPAFSPKFHEVLDLQTSQVLDLQRSNTDERGSFREFARELLSARRSVDRSRRSAEQLREEPPVSSASPPPEQPAIRRERETAPTDAAETEIDVAQPRPRERLQRSLAELSQSLAMVFTRPLPADGHEVAQAATTALRAALEPLAQPDANRAEVGIEVESQPHGPSLQVDRAALDAAIDERPEEVQQALAQAEDAGHEGLLIALDRALREVEPSIITHLDDGELRRGQLLNLQV